RLPTMRLGTGRPGFVTTVRMSSSTTAATPTTPRTPRTAWRRPSMGSWMSFIRTSVSRTRSLLGGPERRVDVQVVLDEVLVLEDVDGLGVGLLVHGAVVRRQRHVLRDGLVQLGDGRQPVACLVLVLLEVAAGLVHRSREGRRR